MIEIKEIPKREVKTYENLINQLFLYESDKFNPLADKKAGKLNNYKKIEKNLKKNPGFLFVVFDNKKPIGYSLGWIYKDEDKLNKIKKFGLICDLFVIEKYRSQGIGKKLIDLSLKWFRKRKINYVNIYAYSKNSAINLYHKLGFKDIWQGLRIKI